MQTTCIITPLLCCGPCDQLIALIAIATCKTVRRSHLSGAGCSGGFCYVRVVLCVTYFLFAYQCYAGVVLSVLVLGHSCGQRLGLCGGDDCGLRLSQGYSQSNPCSRRSVKSCARNVRFNDNDAYARCARSAVASRVELCVADRERNASHIKQHIPTYRPPSTEYVNACGHGWLLRTFCSVVTPHIAHKILSHVCVLRAENKMFKASRSR